MLDNFRRLDLRTRSSLVCDNNIDALQARVCDEKGLQKYC